MTRTPSQNVSFTGPPVGNDDPFEPPGRSIIVAIRDHLRREGLAAQAEDNWRDCGWSIEVTFSTFVIQVALAQTTENHRWMAQIAPLDEPGVLSRLFGRVFVSREPEVLAISRALHGWLLNSGYQAVLWRIDGPPEPANSTREPVSTGEAATP